MQSRKQFQKFAVELKLPDGKPPGFYSQIVKAVANEVRIYDRNKEWFIVETEEEKERLCQIFGKRGVLGEVLEVLELPLSPSPLAEDYGWATAQGRLFLWAEEVSLFLWKKNSISADAQAAREQMEEHLIGSFPWNGNAEILVVPAHIKEVIPRIAAAYGCEIEEMK